MLNSRSIDSNIAASSMKQDFLARGNFDSFFGTNQPQNLIRNDFNIITLGFDLDISRGCN